MQISDRALKAMGSAMLDQIKLSVLSVYDNDGNQIVQLSLGSFRQIKPGIVEMMATAQGYAGKSGKPARYDVRRDGALVLRGDAGELGLSDELPDGALVNLTAFVYEVANGI